MIVENFVFVSHHCALKSPVFSKKLSLYPFWLTVLMKEHSLTLRSPNISFYKSTHVTVMQYGNNNRLNFNHILICGTCLFSLLPIISHVITLLVISSLTRINNNCWKLCFLIWRKELLSKWKGKIWMCCVWWLFLCNCLFSNSGSDLNFACQCLMLDFYQRKGHIIFHVRLVRDLFKWKHKLGSNSLTFGGRVLSWKLCVLCSSVKREKKYWMSFSFYSGECIKCDQHNEFRPPVRL